jgi:murein DD-endopeptidase MepM/ murein hydrolase activator NlpD
MSRIGERPELAIAMAEIFAWDIDFYRDPRAGDEFCMLVEKKEYHNGQPPTYRRVLAARYNNAGTVFDGYMYQGPDDDKPYYYAYDGTSLQSAFLRSPLKFEARVSSHFSPRRLHPVYNTYQPHYGTDYAAPTGTNVHAVASGHVIFAARSGGSGNLVKIRHANGYVTMYLHLSKILVKVGQQVVQGERVGLVGMTGTATGPHLDFRIQRNGGYLNWENLRLPRVSRISGDQMEAYASTRDDYLAQMSPGFPSSQRLAVSDPPAQDSSTTP